MDEEFLRRVPMNWSDSAIVTSMYNDAFAVPIATLGHTLNKDFAGLGIKALVYLDADTLVRNNFDELFALPFNFAAVPDVYIDTPGFTVDFNAGVLFVRPSTTAFHDLVAHINKAKYSHWEAAQAFLNVFYGVDTVRLPYVYNGNIAIKRRNPRLWEGLQDELRHIHFFPRQTIVEGGLRRDRVGLHARQCSTAGERLGRRV
ncbi:nucleotide-diphospho-sugar transferase [Trametes cingulata]|nr:nucleotide-diphospho-sugar transferase [Trametes cingulata]